MEQLYTKKTIEELQEYIGKQVYKKSKKPFLSKSKINTVLEIVDHPFLKNEYGFSFIEDVSIVSVERCVLYNGERL